MRWPSTTLSALLHTRPFRSGALKVQMTCSSLHAPLTPVHSDSPVQDPATPEPSPPDSKPAASIAKERARIVMESETDQSRKCMVLRKPREFNRTPGTPRLFSGILGVNSNPRAGSPEWRGPRRYLFVLTALALL